MTRYKVILADPPWQYRNRGGKGAAENHYPTMATKDICDLPVKQLSHTDCVLILWSTWPNLPEAFKVIDAWGFQFVSGFPWVKLTEPPHYDLFGELHPQPFYGIGFWVRGCSEPILIARKGLPPLPDQDWLGILSERLAHSRKPDSIYQYAESLPGPYLELFARRQRKGWDVYGNEVKGSIDLQEKAAGQWPTI